MENVMKVPSRLLTLLTHSQSDEGLRQIDRDDLRKLIFYAIELSDTVKILVPHHQILKEMEEWK